MGLPVSVSPLMCSVHVHVYVCTYMPRHAVLWYSVYSCEC